MAIVLGVELFNGPIPDRSDLSSFTGRIVDSKISNSKGRIYAEIQVRGDLGNVILVQRMPHQLASKAVQLPPGTTITALIAEKKFTGTRTGLVRRSVWQLSVGGAPIVPYEELLRFHTSEATGWRMFAYGLGAIGVTFLAVFGFRRRSRANP